MESLTEQETAIYDRQIRVWGVEAQRRLSRSHVLVVGLTGATAEVCKNIVLAGIGGLTLVDDRPANYDGSCSNFLLTVDADYEGKSVAEVCADSLKEFNPMVQVSVEGNISNKSENFYESFDAVILNRVPVQMKRHINAICRRRTHNVAYYAVDCWGPRGIFFVDLQTHRFTSTKSADGEVTYSEMEFPSFEDSILVPWSGLHRRMSKLYYAMTIFKDFEEAKDTEAGHVSADDLQLLLDMRKKLCKEQGMSESFVPEALLKSLLDSKHMEFPPVCAIIGGVLGQEVVKALSGKGQPLKNYFLFDSKDGKGLVEDISPPMKGKKPLAQKLTTNLDGSGIIETID